MRQGSNNQSNRRGRGRGHNHNNNRRNGMNRNQNFDSNGPSGRIRGTAKQVYEKYLQLAKDAISSGDRVLAESLYQHADHYGRIAAQFAPKPRPEDAQSDQVDAVTENDETGEDGDQENDFDTESVSIEIQDASMDDDDEYVEETKPVESDERPKRRTRRTPTRRKVDDDTPKLGGGENAVPSFLARPVDLDLDRKSTDDDDDDDDDKPKRRVTRRTPAKKAPAKTATRTRRKKSDDEQSSDDNTSSSSDEVEVV